ncbi:MAG TPA: hypothetical protein EYP78_03495 [Candidatus Omnitrophica bacterium]|nr:hypothetical protein [Candidatus Omnitrophota bacterium]
MVELEKREGCCQYARFYKYKTIGVQKIDKEAVKCLLNGNIHDTTYINLYCSRRFEMCKIYKKEEKAQQWRSGNKGVL